LQLSPKFGLVPSEPFNHSKLPAITGSVALYPNHAGMTVLNSVPTSADRKIGVRPISGELKSLLYRSQNFRGSFCHFDMRHCVELDNVRRVTRTKHYEAQQYQHALHDS